MRGPRGLASGPRGQKIKSNQCTIITRVDEVFFSFSIFISALKSAFCAGI